ncbi:Na+/H+ antiporter NhaC family protein [Brevibacillus borstelensis]|uniref:Na+/H+ antiporter NhaC family protein n=1 Tax=Brevibacillus borstelensis TaxID=45462 RepID=UPI0030C4ABB7
MLAQKEYSVDFRVSRWLSLLPLFIFMVACILFFVVFRIYEMDVLAMGGFVALIIGSLFAKNIGGYWQSVIKGMSSEMANTLILILFVVSFFGKMMALAGVAEGFVWVGVQLHLTGALFTVFTFIIASLLATITGTSIGTLATAFPLLYPAGILLGADPLFLAGAILSGAIFGDSIGPISDVTIASCATQKYTRKEGFAEIGGMVLSRLRYALVAGLISIVLFLIFGGSGQEIDHVGQELIKQYSDPSGLIMLIPVVILLFVAVKSQNIYLAVTMGTLSGIAVALPLGILEVADIFTIKDGNLDGFLINGIRSVIGTIAFLIPLFGIMGVLEESGTMNEIINRLANSKLASTTRGTEIIIMMGTTLSGICLGGANGPACLMFGPLTDKLGKQKHLHPYRRGNLLSGFASTIPVLIPFSSLFIIITNANMNSLVEEFSFIQPINPMLIPVGTIHPIALFLVFLFAVITGWGRLFEGENGVALKQPEVDCQKKHTA